MLNIALEIAQREARMAQLLEDKARIEGNGYIDQEQLRNVTDGINALTNQLAELRAETAAQEQEAEVREAEFAEHVDGLQQQIQDADPFGKLFPREDFESLFGLTDYGEYQKQLNGFIYGVLMDQGNELFNKNKFELAQKDTVIASQRDQIRAGADREFQLNRQNNELQKALNDKEIVLQDTERRADEAEEKIEALQAELNDSTAEIRSLKAQVDELNQRLAETQKPKVVATSQTFAERIDQLKPIKSLKDLAADDLLKRFEDRQNNGGKVNFDLPNLGGPSFRDTELESGGVSDGTSTQDGAAVQPLEFQADSDSTAIDSVAGHTTESQDVGPTVESRLAALEVAVFGSAKVAA